MERRKANRCLYDKFASKDPRTVNITSLRRSRSMRASLRTLKGKLSQANRAASPFKFNTALHKSIKRYEKLASNEEREIKIKENQISKTTTKQLCQEIPTKMDECINCEDSHQHIEDIMSNLPLGKVPSKACKLLQIPETYCRKYLQELQQEQQQSHSECCTEDTNKVDGENLNSVKGNQLHEDLAKSVSQGIYGTTRVRTATIRKPMPYLNSSMFSFYSSIFFPLHL